MDSEPKPFVPLVMDGSIRQVECSTCGDYIGHWDGVERGDDQQAKLQDEFAKHMRLRHPNNAAAYAPAAEAKRAR